MTNERQKMCTQIRTPSLFPSFLVVQERELQKLHQFDVDSQMPTKPVAQFTGKNLVGEKRGFGEVHRTQRKIKKPLGGGSPFLSGWVAVGAAGVADGRTGHQLVSGIVHLIPSHSHRLRHLVLKVPCIHVLL